MECVRSSAVRLDDDFGLASPIACRAWGCVDCGPVRRRQLIEHAIDGRANRLVTLTSRVIEGKPPADAAKELAHAWQVVLKRYARLRKGQRPQYLVVFEATKEGWPHLHILWRGPWIDQGWLSNRMDELIDSPVVSVEKIHDCRVVARYVAKYLGKAPHKFGTCKRYWTSQRWRLTPKPDHKRIFTRLTVVERWLGTPAEIAKSWRTQGKRVFRNELGAHRWGAMPWHQRDGPPEKWVPVQ